MILFNPNPFIYTLGTMKARMLDLAPNERLAGLTMLSIGSHVHLLAVIEYAMRPDVLGPLPELIQQQEINLKFYHYDGLQPWDE